MENYVEKVDNSHKSRGFAGVGFQKKAKKVEKKRKSSYKAFNLLYATGEGNRHFCRMMNIQNEKTARLPKTGG